MNPTLLIVEDEGSDVHFLKRAFAKVAPQIALRFAYDGPQAMADLERGDIPGEHPFPSLAMLDLKLPRLSGLDLLQWIRSRPQTKELPVIIRSSSTELSDVERAYALGCSFYVAKELNFGPLYALARGIGSYLELQSRSTVRLPLFGI